MKKNIYLLVILFGANVLFVLPTFSQSDVTVLKSKNGKHIIQVKKMDYQQDGTLTISNGDSISANFKILKVDKTKTKLMVEGPKLISLKEMCAQNCQLSQSGGSLIDEFSIGTPQRLPASQK